MDLPIVIRNKNVKGTVDKRIIGGPKVSLVGEGKGIFRTMSNIHDAAFLRKQLRAFSAVFVNTHPFLKFFLIMCMLTFKDT